MEKGFKREKDDSYRLLIDDNKSGIFFHIPDNCKIEDYNIVLTGDEFKPSKRAHFTLLEGPSKMGEIRVDVGAEIQFKKNINIAVKKFLRLGKNNNFSINAYGSTSVCYDEMEISNNADTEITLVRENPRPSLVDQAGVTPILPVEIKNNNYCIFDIGTEVKKFAINNNQSQTVLSFPAKISVVGADYAVIENNKIDPYCKGSILFVETLGGFILENANMEIRGKNFIRNIYQQSNKAEVPSITMKDGDLKFDNAVIETGAVNFVINGKGNTISFEGNTKITTDKSVAITGENELNNINITCLGTSIYLRNNGLLKDSIINFVPDENNTGARTILKSEFTNAKITNVVDDLSLFINRCLRNEAPILCDQISMRGEDSHINISLEYGTFFDTKISMPITLEKIKIDAHSKLEIKLDPGADDKERLSLPIDLKNITVDSYGVLELFQGIKAENCSFKKLLYTATLNDRDKVQELDNVICEGVVKLKNVEKISRCDIDNLELLNEKEIQLHDELFCDKGIYNYEDFVQKREGRNKQLQESSPTTDDIELL